MTHRTRPRIALLLAALAALLAAPLGPALATTRAAEAAEPPVAASGLVLTGNGFGHGKGLSQYGANGAAKAGLSTAQILAFYYPGTATGSFTGRVRVWITADNDHSTVVRPANGLTLTDLGNGHAYRLPVGTAKRWRLAVVSGKTRVTYLVGTTWRPYRPGGNATLVGGGEFRSSANLLSLVIGGVDHRYRGGLRLVDGRTVNVLGIDLYLRGVVPSEMPALWLAPALGAQAVAARTYATFERAENIGRSYQICDTSACQVYGGYDAEQSQTNAAVVATAGRILTSGGAPAFTQFSASNGGWSVAGGESYLVAKADPYDVAYHHWTKPLDVAALQRARPDLGALKTLQVLSRDGHGEWGGRVLSIRLTYAQGSIVLDGSTFRSWAGLRSNWFSLTG